MKAVLLAGGLGTRMREHTEFRPKPMVEVGGRPVLWHIMKVLSVQGINEFIICTGYKSEFISNYFANYGRVHKDYTIRLGDDSKIVFHDEDHDEANWLVTVAYTGANTMTGGRIKRVQKYIGDERFFCTYGDGIADVNISELVACHEKHGRAATLTTTRPLSRFGVVDTDGSGNVTAFREKPQLDDWVNIGYFIFEPAVFDLLEGDDTVLERAPLHALATSGQLAAYRHHGFWQPMDTQRESEMLNELWNQGAPWRIWGQTPIQPTKE